MRNITHSSNKLLVCQTFQSLDKFPELKWKSQLRISSVGIHFTAKRATLTRDDAVAGVASGEGGGGASWLGFALVGGVATWLGFALVAGVASGEGRGGAPWLGFSLFDFASQVGFGFKFAVPVVAAISPFVFVVVGLRTELGIAVRVLKF